MREEEGRSCRAEWGQRSGGAGAQPQDWSVAGLVERGKPLLESEAVESQGGVALGKGAWDCDAGQPISPEDEPLAFEEVPTGAYLYEGIPLVPPRANLAHMSVLCGGCRYRVEAYPDWTVGRLKRALWEGGIRRSDPSEAVRRTPGLSAPEDLALVYATRVLADEGRRLEEYGMPPGCQVLLGVEAARLRSGRHERDAAYWN